MKKYLISGISGFVGKYLADFLTKKNYEVSGFDRKGSIIPKVNISKIDILDKEAVKNFIKEIKPDYIIHLAAQSSVKKSWDNPEETITINVEGTRNLLEGVIAAGIVPQCKILIVTSAEIYGVPKEVPIKESHPLSPSSPYGESRLKQEELIEDYRKKGIHITVSRSFPHTGPGQSDQFVCSSFSRQIAEINLGKQEPIIKVGNLEAIRDFTDVRDIIEAYHLILTKELKGTYNICSGKGIKIDDMLQTLIKLSDKQIEIEQDPSRDRPSDIPILIGDNSKFCEETGWKPNIPFEQTLGDLFAYWKRNL